MKKIVASMVMLVMLAMVMAPAMADAITFPLEEPVTMSMFAIINGAEIQDTNAFKKYTEMTNVQWEVQSSMGADLTEKRNLLFNSNNYPGVFFKSGLNAADIEGLVAQGVLLPLDDIIAEHAPNLSRILEERPAVRDLITASDGHIYSLPEVDRPTPAIPIPFINQGWLAALNLEEPTTLDELYEVLKAFKEQDPNGNGEADEIPMTTTTVVPPTLLLPYFGIEFNNDTMTAIKDGQLEFVPTMEEFKDFLAFFTKLYSEELLDKNGLTQAHEMQAAIGSQGDVLGLFFDAGAFLTVPRDRDEDYKELTPFVEGVFPVGTGASAGTMVITDACETPELAVAWADYFYTEEGGILAWLGVEGETYNLTDDGTWEWASAEYTDIGDIRKYGTIQGAAVHPSVQPELWFTGITDPDERYLNEERQRIVDVGADPFPALSYSEADNQTIATIWADVEPYYKEYMAQVITGQITIEDSWDNYLATMDAMGLSELMEIRNAAFTAATN